MTVEKLSFDASLVVLQALAIYLDLGSSNAAFVLYEGVRPASVTSVADPTKRIVTLNLPKPCTRQLNPDNVELYPTQVGIADKSGTVTWARLYNGEGKAVADFNIGDSDAIVLDDYDVLIGASIKLDSVTLSPP